MDSVVFQVAYNTCYTANEGPARIQYKCLVQIYVFPEMRLHGFVLSKKL
jgi:hypothetical protein